MARAESVTKRKVPPVRAQSAVKAEIERPRSVRKSVSKPAVALTMNTGMKTTEDQIAVLHQKNSRLFFPDEHFGLARLAPGGSNTRPIGKATPGLEPKRA
jgi:hypothetical protein